MLATIERAFEDIRAERDYQDVKWGGPAHDDAHTSGYDWIAFITVYAGKGALAFGAEDTNDRALRVFRTMMVKVGALAVAAIQWVDRKLG